MYDTLCDIYETFFFLFFVYFCGCFCYYVFIDYLVKRDKEMIPSKRLQSNLRNLYDLIQEHFEKKVLVKTNPSSYSYYYQSKGVSSDQIFIFYAKNKELRSYTPLNEMPSFAIVFDYIGKEEENYSAMISFKVPNPKYKPNLKNKKEEQFIYTQSKIYDIESFRKILNELNKRLKLLNESKEDNYEKIMSVVYSSFFESTLNIDEEVEKLHEQIKIAAKNQKSIVNKFERDFKKDTENFNSAKLKFEEDINNTPEQIRILELEKELASLKVSLSKKKESLSLKHDIDNLKKSMNKSKSNLDNAKIKYANIVADEKKKVPLLIARHVNIKI